MRRRQLRATGGVRRETARHAARRLKSAKSERRLSNAFTPRIGAPLTARANASVCGKASVSVNRRTSAPNGKLWVWPSPRRATRAGGSQADAGCGRPASAYGMPRNGDGCRSGCERRSQPVGGVVRRSQAFGNGHTSERGSGQATPVESAAAGVLPAHGDSRAAYAPVGRIAGNGLHGSKDTPTLPASAPFQDPSPLPILPNAGVA